MPVGKVGQGHLGGQPTMEPTEVRTEAELGNTFRRMDEMRQELENERENLQGRLNNVENQLATIRGVFHSLQQADKAYIEPLERAPYQFNPEGLRAEEHMPIPEERMRP